MADELHPVQTPLPNDPSRRDVLMAGGMLLSMIGLSGCATGGGEYPDPPWPGAGGKSQTTPSKVTTKPTGGAGPLPPTTPSGVISRAQWTRMGVGRPDIIYPMGGIHRITVHHEGSDMYSSTSFDDTARRLESIRRYHVNSNAWADIAYHYIIDPAGRVWEGRSVRSQGAHVKEQNENNLGVMCLGNFDLQQPTRATTSALDRFVASQMRVYRVPISRVFTHQEIGKSVCPGRNLQRHMVATRRPGGGMTLA